MSSVRIWGAVAAVVLAGLFGWVVWATFGAERVVVREVAVRPAGQPGAPVGALLANRTRLQDEASVATGRSKISASNCRQNSERAPRC